MVNGDRRNEEAQSYDRDRNAKAGKTEIPKQKKKQALTLKKER